MTRTFSGFLIRASFGLRHSDFGFCEVFKNSRGSVILPVNALAATVIGEARKTCDSLCPMRPGKFRLVALMHFIGEFMRPNVSTGPPRQAAQPADTFGDRKSTRLNSSHRCISYAVFCLKKKKKYYIDMMMCDIILHIIIIDI